MLSKSTKTRNRLNFYEAVRDLNSRRRFGLKLELQNMKQEREPNILGIEGRLKLSIKKPLRIDQ